MEEILHILCLGDFPVILVAPIIRSHDKNPYMVAGCELILSSLKKIVVPLERPFINVVLCFRTEVHIAMATVTADRNDEVLAFPCTIYTAMIAYSFIIAQRAAEKCVVPRGYM